MSLVCCHGRIFVSNFFSLAQGFGFRSVFSLFIFILWFLKMGYSEICERRYLFPLRCMFLIWSDTKMLSYMFIGGMA